MSFYLIIGLYILLVLGVSYYFSLKSSAEDYLISGRDRSNLNILASKFAAAVGVSTFITYTGYAYRFGAFGVGSLMLGIIIGYGLFAFWAAPKINRLSLKGNFYTQGDLVSAQTDSDVAGKLTNGTTIAIQFFWILLSLVGGAKIIAHFEILPYTPALLLTSSVILVYVLLSGFKAVIITDLFQAIIIIAFLLIIATNISGNGTSINALLQITPPEKMKLGALIGLLLYGALSVFGLADRYQLCYSAKNEQAARRGMSQSILPILLVATLLFYLGLVALNANSDLEADYAFIYAMENMLSTQYYPLLLVLFFAGLMSSADTNIFAVATHLTKKDVSKEKKVKTTRYYTVIVVVIATVVSVFWTDIIDITIVGAAMRLTLSVPMIYALRKKNIPSRSIGSVVLGIVALVIGIFILGADPKLALLVLLGTLIGLLFKRK